MFKLVCKTFAIPFYLQHAGLFAIAAYLLFGMIKGYDLIAFHLALLISICSSSVNLALTFVFWSLYAAKAIIYVRKTVQMPANGFIYELPKLPAGSQLKLWFKIYALIFLPILTYSAIMIVISVGQIFFIALFAVPTVVALLMLIATVYTFRYINHTHNPLTTWVKLPNYPFNRPYWTWPLYYLFHEQKLVLAVCKLVSFLFFKAILWIFADIGFDVRVFLTTMLAVILSHAFLVSNLLKFDAATLGFIKAQPILPFKRLLNCIAVYGLLLLPELSMLAWITELNTMVLVNSILLSLGGLLTMQTMFYCLSGNTERYFKWLLFFLFAAMLAILAGYYFWFSSFMVMVGAIYYVANYNRMDLKKLV